MTITASAAAHTGSSDTVDVIDDDVAALTITIGAESIGEGDSSGATTATISRNTDTTSALTVNLASDDTSEVSVPATLTIPAGQVSVTFDIDAVDDADVDGTQTVTITASAAAHTDGSDTVDVTDDDEQTDLFYFSRKNTGTVGESLTFENEDIVAFDGTDFRIYFDGTPWARRLTLDAFAIEDSDDILMSFTGSGSITGGSLSFDDSDIIRYSPDSQTWEMYFDGSDVGLTTNSEDVDAIGFAPDGRLLISTRGSASVDDMNSADEDLLAFSSTSLGSNTAGTFELYFDGSDVGLSSSSREDIDAVSVTSDGAIYISTVGSFNVLGSSGNDEDIVVFDATTLGSNTSGSFRSALFFDGSSFGFGNDVGGLAVVNAPLLSASISLSSAVLLAPTVQYALAADVLTSNSQFSFDFGERTESSPSFCRVASDTMAFQACWSALSVVRLPAYHANDWYANEGILKQAAPHELEINYLDQAFADW